MPYAWHAHPDVWVLIAVLFGGYVWALRRLGPRHTAPGQPAATRLQKACWVTGVLTVWVAADWPVHDLSEKFLYSVHMTQHLLITLVAPPLLLLGTPAWLARELLRPAGAVPGGAPLARPFPALLLFNALVVVTHWPTFVDATLRLRAAPLHDPRRAVHLGAADVGSGDGAAAGAAAPDAAGADALPLPAVDRPDGAGLVPGLRREADLPASTSTCPGCGACRPGRTSASPGCS